MGSDSFRIKGILPSLVTGLVVTLVVIAAYSSSGHPGPILFQVDVVGDGPAPILGVIVDQNYKVVGLVPNGAAEQAGVQVGDSIKQVNGQPITGGNSALRIFRRLDKSKHVMLVLERGKKELDVKLIPLPPPLPQAPLGAPAPTGTPMPPELLYY